MKGGNLGRVDDDMPVSHDDPGGVDEKPGTESLALCDRCLTGDIAAVAGLGVPGD